MKLQRRVDLACQRGRGVVRIAKQDRQLVAVAEHRKPDAVVRIRTPFENALVVPVDGRRGETHAGKVAQHRAKDRVEPTATGGDRHRKIRKNGAFSESAHVERADGRHGVVPGRARRAQTHIDDPSHAAAVLGREVAGVEVDAIQHLGGDHARESAEVVNDRQIGSVGKDLRVDRRRAAHDEGSR